jgi:acyl-[acyl-carrier-protein]-phospholipid O-acyltransferase/long-chain-fatty-acid--[acyl-carrier-protein] ligase
MILTGALLICVAAAWLVVALVIKLRLGLGMRQALLYAPLKLAYRIEDSEIAGVRATRAPVVYAVVHQSRLDPALMLALLPESTLHILDEHSARTAWLEPFRELARTIAFNPQHVFVSRRLVRQLRGGGQLAVYLPDAVEPDIRTYRLFRAVAHIAARAEARIVPIVVGGARALPFSLMPREKAPRRLFPQLTVSALEGQTLKQLMDAAGPAASTISNALFDRIAETRLAALRTDRPLFLAVRDAADRLGASHAILEDALSGSMSYRQMMIGARLLGSRFAAETHDGETVGLMLPNGNAFVMALLGLLAGGRVATMLNYTAGPANITAAVSTAVVRIVYSSRVFVEKANLGDIVAAIEKGGARVIWLEDLRAKADMFDKLSAALMWRRPLGRQDADRPAIILFTSGAEGTPRAVVLTGRNLNTNARQAEARIAFGADDKLMNVLPVFHSFGLLGGVLLPLIAGVRLYLYPSPLHYKLIPQAAAKVKPTVMFGTDSFLAAYARTAKDADFASVRLLVAGAEAVKPETRRVWRERFGAEIVEGYGLTEAAPVVAVNTAIHGRDGTVGRLLPGVTARLEPVEGVSPGGRLWISGPNLMLGYINSDRPGELQKLENGWHDTGDIVSFDRDGFVTIRGRAKRFAKIAGEMVSLGAVEMLVQALWPEARHAVVSVPDKRRGERIVLVTTAEQAEPNALRQFGKQSGAAEITIPDAIVKVEALPLLGSGKTDYVGARRVAVAQLGLDAAA